MKSVQKMERLLYRTKLYLKRASPTILTCVGAIGVAATAATAVRATPKALRLLEAAADEKGGKLSRLETALTAGPIYIPAASVGLSTIACIFGANALNRRQQAVIAGAYLFASRMHREYKGKAKELLGSDADGLIREAVAKGKYIEAGNRPDYISASGEKQLFYEEHYGKFFERSKEEVLSAEYHFNRNFALRGYACLNEFYEFLGLPKTKAGETLGWSLDVGMELYGYSWVDFGHESFEMDDGLECCAINMPFPPTADYMDVNHC
jgi:hypothetical protein